MCGFVAYFLPHGARPDPELLNKMTDSLQHRGPDARGVRVFEGCGLGHRRLSIVDLDGGIQPMQGARPDTWCVYNGETYNADQLRPRLRGPFQTRSDTEVFLRAFEQHGLQGLDALNGMWGAAIWQGEKRTLTVIRDRMGIKPVYYTELPDGGFIFASEIRALMEHSGVGSALDSTALDQLLTYRYIPSPRTLFKGIYKLPPGHVAVVNDQGLQLKSYLPPIPSPRAISDQQAEEQFLSLLEDAVDKRLMADVPLGVFLSGGVDSAAILAAAKRPGLDSYTIAFEGGEQDDERAFAEETARLYGARHHTLMIGPREYQSFFDDYVTWLEEPILNDSAFATYALAARASQDVKVVLTGQGADEPLAGYDRFKGEYLAPWFQRLGLARARGLVEGTALPEKLKRGFRSLGEADPIARALRIYAVFQEEDKRALLRPEVVPDEPVTAPIERFHAQVPHLSPLGRMLHTDTRMWLVEDLLLVADKLSMQHGLELRVPFLDHRLVAFVQSLPDEQKLRLGRSGLITKYVHRQAMKRWLPQEILSRKKRGFTNPMHQWMRDSLKPMLEERLLDAKSPLYQWVQPEAVRQLMERHFAGHDQRRQLFLLLSIEAWARAFSVG